MKIWRCIITGILCVMVHSLFLAPLSAQEDEKTSVEDLKKALEDMRAEYEARISDLETALEIMEGEAREVEVPMGGEKLKTGRDEVAYYEDRGVSPGLLGQLGQTDRFSSVFNPAVGLSIDVIANANTDNKSLEGEDKSWLRSAELSLAAQIDPFGYAYAVIEGEDGGDINVIEAAGVLNRLPANFSLKGGRILADITKFGQRHDHEMPFVEKPRVLTEFIGGSLQGTGAEVHQWFGLTDEIPVRWSMGMFSKLEGHNHAIGFEHEHDHHHESDSKRTLADFHYGGRLTGYMDLDEENSIQIGTSVWWAPDILHDEETFREHTRRAVGAFDVTYKWQDPSSRRTFFLGGEALVSNGTFIHEEVSGPEKKDDEAVGGYLWCEYGWNPNWSAGLLADAYALPEHSEIGQRDYSAFLTWKLSHFNRLRFQYRYNDLERGEGSRGRDYHEFLLQWSFIIGSHSHGLDW